MQVHKYILENTDILRLSQNRTEQLSQKYLAFEINVAKEIKKTINFNLMSEIQWVQQGLKFSAITILNVAIVLQPL